MQKCDSSHFRNRICFTVGDTSSSFATDTWSLNGASCTVHLSGASFCLIVHYQPAEGSEPSLMMAARTWVLESLDLPFAGCVVTKFLSGITGGNKQHLIPQEAAYVFTH